MVSYQVYIYMPLIYFILALIRESPFTLEDTPIRLGSSTQAEVTLHCGLATLHRERNWRTYATHGEPSNPCYQAVRGVQGVCTQLYASVCVHQAQARFTGSFPGPGRQQGPASTQVASVLKQRGSYVHLGQT
jgi:hypothetical protein